MMNRAIRCLRFAGVLVLFQFPIAAPPPGDIAFTVATKDGRTAFQLGEPIRIELRFRAETPGRYLFYAGGCFRPANPAFDRIRAEPPENVEDLAEPDYRREPTGVSALPPEPIPLGPQVVSVECFLNDWAFFRKPGHYRIVAESARIARINPQAVVIPVRSGALEIDILPADTDAARARLQQAAAVLERQYSGAVVASSEWIDAINTVRFSQLREAVPVLLRLLSRRQDQAAVNGLWASPYKAEIFAEMARSLEAPDFAVREHWVFLLAQLDGALQAPPLKTTFSPELNRKYFAKLAEVLDRKQGPARVATLSTLIDRGVVYGDLPATESFLNAVYQTLPDLPRGIQEEILTDRWTFVATPKIEPFLRSWAAGNIAARDLALLRLETIDPAEARRIALDRIRRGDFIRDFSSGRPRAGYEALLGLPDALLPELDVPLAEAYEAQKPVGDLIARYSSNSVYRRIRTAFEKRQPGPWQVCGVNTGLEPIVVYFYRVDPGYADQLLAAARREANWSCPLASPLVPNPGLEQAAIRDLLSSDPALRLGAVEILRNSSSEAAKQRLREALVASRGLPVDSGNLESEYAAAFVSAPGWLLSPEEFSQVISTCTRKECADIVARRRDALKQPVLIDARIENLETIGVGTLQLPINGFERKIRQFPAGTEFRFSPEGQKAAASWSGDMWAKRIRQILQTAGMKLVDKP